jgi:hypothetical protein
MSHNHSVPISNDNLDYLEQLCFIDVLIKDTATRRAEGALNLHFHERLNQAFCCRKMGNSTKSVSLQSSRSKTLSWDAGIQRDICNMFESSKSVTFMTKKVLSPQNCCCPQLTPVSARAEPSPPHHAPTRSAAKEQTTTSSSHDTPESSIREFPSPSMAEKAEEAVGMFHSSL